MTSSRRSRPMWTLIRLFALTTVFVTTFQLGRIYEMRSELVGQDLAGRVVNADGSFLLGVDDTMASSSGVKRQPNSNGQNASVHIMKIGDVADNGAPDIANDRRLIGVDAAFNENGRNYRDENRAVKNDESSQLPDDFWNGRKDDDIVVDTRRPIVNSHPFRRTIESRSLCGGENSQGADVFLICYVHTAVDHFKRRARIRETWARQENYNDTTIRTVFLTGRTDKAGWLQDALEFEAKKYGDIVQEDFLDTYRNLSYKGIAALRWIATHCSRASYVLKTDDDMFVNMFALIKHLKDLHTAGYRRRLLMCYVWWKMHVLREGQWGIPVENMPDDLYPVYCSGMGYVFTTDVAVAMYRVSYFERFFWVDDVYISGCLPRALKGAVNHTEMSRAYCGAHEMGVYEHQTEWHKYIFSHVHDEELYVKTWRRLVEIARSVPKIPTPSIVRPGQLAEEYIPKHVLFPENKKRSKNKGHR